MFQTETFCLLAFFFFLNRVVSRNSPIDIHRSITVPRVPKETAFFFFRLMRRSNVIFAVNKALENSRDLPIKPDLLEARL